jgi:uncharacterized protein (TIGR03435 family)
LRELAATAKAIAGLLMLFVPAALAQAQFEIASIKPVDRADIPKSINFRGGGLKATNCSLKDLIQMGWDVRSFQVTGGPGWLESEKYNVEAKPPTLVDIFAPGSGGINHVRLMIQALLAERFELKLHREEKEMSVCFLRVAKNGIRLERTGEGIGPKTSMNDGRGRLNATEIDMGMLARELGGAMGVAVIDQTALQGAYDIKLIWDPDQDPSAQASISALPSLFAAVQQIGLKLESGRASVEVLVVDHATKASPN